MPRLLPALAALLLASALAPPTLGQSVRDGQVVDGIVAVVGNHPILRSDVEALAASFARMGMTPTEARRTALDELIMQRVLIVHAERDTTITVSPDEVTEALDQRTQALVRQLGSEEAVEEAFGRRIAQLREDYRQEVRRQLLAQRLQQREYLRVRITPREVRQWFEAIPPDSLPEVPETVRVAHIVRFPEIEPAAREEALQRITALRDSVVAGTATIEDIARRHSDDPGSRNTGGRYAQINLRDLVPEFGAVAGTLRPGELSQVFQTEFGFHFMRLNSRRADVIDFNHVLVRIDPERTNPEPAIRLLTALRDSAVVHGVPFARLARDHSEDPASSGRGGNVVVPQTGDRDLRFEALGPLWQATLDTLAVGEISQPARVTLLDGRQAYHIVKLQRRVPAHRLSLEKDWPLIEEFALQEKRQRELEAWANRLRRQVYIACMDPAFCPEDLTARR